MLVVLLWLLGWAAVALFVLPGAAIVLILSLGYPAILAIWNRAQGSATPARRKVRQTRAQVIALQTSQAVPNPTAVLDDLRAAFEAKGICARSFLGGKLLHIGEALYRAEGFCAPPPGVPDSHSALDLALLCDKLEALAAKIGDPRSLQIFTGTIALLGEGFSRQLPQSLWAEPAPDGDDGAAKTELSVSLLDYVSEPAGLASDVVEAVTRESVRSARLFEDLRLRIDKNIYAMSELPFASDETDPRKLVLPSKYKGTPEEIARGYLRGTPFAALLNEPVPFVLPAAVCYEHQWILAGSGHGKTQALQCLIVQKLDEVAKGRATVVVIDSQAELIGNIARLKLFAPGQPLHERLCLIDPSDIAWPVALNLFDVQMERINRYSALDRERLINSVLELYDFVLSSLLSAELTQKQNVVFRFITRLLLEIPDATIFTFRELMEPNGFQKYRPYVEHLDGTARTFFETEFNNRQFDDTKRQVVRRLWGVLENRTFERMFSHPRSKLDLFAEINAGKVILINTCQDLLKRNGMEIFGRFFIALIAQAAQERATLPKEGRMPTYILIDECSDYMDQNVAMILQIMRKFNVGLILAHQHLGQLTPKLFDSLSANTSIKFAGGVSDKDARTMAHMMRCTPEFIDAQPKGSFAAYVRNVTPRTVSLRIPLGLMERMPKMTEGEFTELRNRMRERYATHWKELERERAGESRTSADDPRSRDFDPTAFSADWQG